MNICSFLRMCMYDGKDYEKYSLVSICIYIHVCIF